MDEAPIHRAPPSILAAWRGFDGVPMETLTKAFVARTRGPRQRTIAEMEADRARVGASGNCFDLAIWLHHRLTLAGVAASFVADDIASGDAHVAVIAEADGRAFLCDLGDMWLEPAAIDEAITEPVAGLFPAAAITTTRRGSHLEVTYHRPGGKRSAQAYDLTPVAPARLLEAAADNQRTLAQRLVEVRAFAEGAHWEFHEYTSFWSTPAGKREEPPLADDAAWARRIAARTGMDAGYVEACLAAFRALTAPS